MVTAFVDFHVRDPAGFSEALATTGGLFDEVQGFNGFRLVRGIEDDSRFLIIADWDSVADHQAWQKAHAEQFLGVLGPHISGLPEITHFE